MATYIYLTNEDAKCRFYRLILDHCSSCTIRGAKISLEQKTTAVALRSFGLIMWASDVAHGFVYANLC